MKVLIFTLSFLIFASPLMADVIDNAEFADNLADSTVVKLFKLGNNNPSKNYLIKSEKSHPANFILEQSLIKYIKSNNGNVFVQLEGNDDNNFNTDIVCEYIAVDLNLTYNKARVPYPKGKKIWRKGRLLTIFRFLSTEDGEVINTNEIEVVSEDYISEKEAADFNNLGSFYLKPDIPGRSFKRFAEPILVGTTVAAMIFLFFSNR
jgi:hypothetical protein